MVVVAVVGGGIAIERVGEFETGSALVDLLSTKRTSR